MTFYVIIMTEDWFVIPQTIYPAAGRQVMETCCTSTVFIPWQTVTFTVHLLPLDNFTTKLYYLCSDGQHLSAPTAATSTVSSASGLPEGNVANIKPTFVFKNG